MKPEHTNLKQQQHSEQVNAHQQFQHGVTQTQVTEFASVDDLLRFDSGQNPVPPDVAERLNRSIATEPKPEQPWYKKLFH